eukprot:CAMPEP_0118636178 /NCGR_PEP_ID=MMETSP0785-20121206/2475_1 /TAXON_ID=91992 /ORGANISM="Bolidomonas pacifica, Strain CCMP 1866" /LENGTH=53 /DNA_ID=CAMNT_0006527269 /DNA_START=279 /DNA_END=437 /DNA_ORIENTATION=-
MTRMALVPKSSACLKAPRRYDGLFSGLSLPTFTNLTQPSLHSASIASIASIAS